MPELEFEWDTEKERENIRDHGVDFSTAEQVFFDPLRMERRGDDSGGDEDRWQTMGFFNVALFAACTERGNAIRIISARAAEPFERRIYHGNSETRGWQRAGP